MKITKLYKGRKFCPKCKSFNVKIDITASSVFGVPQNWICNDCDYSNFVFPELNKLELKK